jgi:hypothetical protein
LYERLNYIEVKNVLGILSMILYLNFARPLISGFAGGQEGNELETRLVDHIVQFSLNGVGTGREEVGK